LARKSADIAMLAARLHVRHSLTLPDAIQIATAVHAGCFAVVATVPSELEAARSRTTTTALAEAPPGSRRWPASGYRGSSCEPGGGGTVLELMIYVGEGAAGDEDSLPLDVDQ
jgi:hypothetical protein